MNSGHAESIFSVNMLEESRSEDNPEDSPAVFCHLDTLETFKKYPFPDHSYVYLRIWNEEHFIAVLMNYYQMTLRSQINPMFEITELQWFNIMLGIVSRLAVPHESDIVHGDLCPSNS
jgi:hypothetical protein